MPSLTLAYIGLGVSNVADWLRFAGDILGMEACGTGADGAQLLRFDDRAWRIALHQSDADDLLYAGYEVADGDALAALKQRVEAGGTAIRDMTPAEAEARKALGGALLKDPDGLDIEVVHGLQEADGPFRSPQDVTFVTGPMGLGHIVVTTADPERSLGFYRALGFEISDYIETAFGPDLTVTIPFLHCNERHHTLALLPVPMPKRLNHLMVEVSTVDEVIAAYYRAQKDEVPIVRHLGRHTNDRMLSFYAQTPAGFDVEYGCDGLHVRSDWEIRTYDAISIWGHEA